MSSEMTTLGEFATVQGGYAYKSQDFKSTGEWSVLKIKNVRNGHVSYDDTSFVSTEVATATSKWATKPGDILISMTGSGPSSPESLVGRAARVWKGEKSALINQRVGRLILKESSNIDLDFLFYLLSLKESQDFLVSNSTGSANQVNISAKTIESVPCPKIDHDISTDIASILLSLDGKIRLLRETNTTLEAIAQALFKSWFVDFDPVRAKQKGREPEGMDAATAALFPDSFEESELGLVPKGWEVTTIKNLTTKIGSGATPRGGREVYLDEGVALIRSQNVYDSEFVWAGLARISDEAATQLSGVEVKQHDVLLNITGASILRTCVVNPDALPARVNQHVAIIRAKPGISARYIHLHLLQQKTKNYLMALNSGASREAITKSHIEHLPILNPRLALLTCFQEVVAPVYAKAEQTAAQSQTLATLRDTVLPRLISGQLRLPEVEAMLKDSCDADTAFGQ